MNVLPLKIQHGEFTVLLHVSLKLGLKSDHTVNCGLCTYPYFALFSTAFWALCFYSTSSCVCLVFLVNIFTCCELSCVMDLEDGMPPLPSQADASLLETSHLFCGAVSRILLHLDTPKFKAISLKSNIFVIGRPVTCLCAQALTL